MSAKPETHAILLPRRGAVRRAGRAPLAAAVVAALALQVPATALAGASYVQAPVVAVDPIYETVRFSEPREVCRNERVAVEQASRHGGSRDRRSATGPLLGGVIGGALGNAVGRDSDNKKIGTVIGAILGASIGSDIQRRSRNDRVGPSPYRTVYENREICERVDVTRERQEIVGYEVAYEYAGRTAYTRMDRDPGATIRLRVDVTPVP